MPNVQESFFNGRPFGFRPGHLLVIFWLSSFLLGMVDGECGQPDQPMYHVKETDPPGTKVFSVTATNGASWKYELIAPNQKEIKEYLSFQRSGDGYVMALAKQLDVEELLSRFGIKDAVFIFHVICSQSGKQDLKYETILVSDPVNQYPPTFNTSSIVIHVKESANTQSLPWVPFCPGTPLQTSIQTTNLIKLIDWASDRDHNPMTDEIKGFEFLKPGNPQLGIVQRSGTVYSKSPLDYESLPDGQKYLEVGVKVLDRDDNSATADLTIHVTDIDDLPPRFVYPGCPAPCDFVYYTSDVGVSFTGTLKGIKPAPIKAVDVDTFGSKMKYFLRQGPTGFRDYIKMDADTAEVTIRKPLSGMLLSEFVVVVQAQEQSTLQRATSTAWLIAVRGHKSTVDADNRRGGGSVTHDKIDGLPVGTIISIMLFLTLLAILFGIYCYQTWCTGADPLPIRASTLLSPDNNKSRRHGDHLSHEDDQLRLRMTLSRQSEQDKKSGPGDSPIDADPNNDPGTERAKVGVPTG